MFETFPMRGATDHVLVTLAHELEDHRIARGLTVAALARLLEQSVVRTFLLLQAEIRFATADEYLRAIEIVKAHRGG